MIIGGTGYCGTSLATAIASSGVRVRVFDVMKPSSTLPVNVSFVQVNFVAFAVSLMQVTDYIHVDEHAKDVELFVLKLNISKLTIKAIVIALRQQVSFCQDSIKIKMMPLDIQFIYRMCFSQCYYRERKLKLERRLMIFINEN